MGPGLGSCFRGASGSHPSMVLPCLCLVRPGQSPALGSRWDMFPIRFMESSRASGGTALGDQATCFTREQVLPRGWGGRRGDRETLGVAQEAAQLQSLQLLHC